MATLSLGQAAKVTATSKTTLTRAIKSGKLSAIRNNDGSYSIDPAELSRVYAVTPETSAAPVTVVRHATPPETSAVTGVTVAVMQAQVEALRELLAEVKQSRDDWKGQAERLALNAPAPARSWLKRLIG